MNTCESCKYLGHDIDLNGYCGCKTCVKYHCVVIDDNGCHIQNCMNFDSDETVGSDE